MVSDDRQARIYQCDCRACRQKPRSRLARVHRSINRLLASSDERIRRLFAGFLSEQMGAGGVSQLARITGLDRKTIAKGRRELHDRDFTDTWRVRRCGGGRKTVEMQNPES